MEIKKFWNVATFNSKNNFEYLLRSYVVSPKIPKANDK